MFSVRKNEYKLGNGDEIQTRQRSPVIGLPDDSKSRVLRKGARIYLQLRHQRFDGMEKFACGRVGCLLQIQELFESRKQFVEPFRFDHRPWNDF